MALGGSSASRLVVLITGNASGLTAALGQATGAVGRFSAGMSRVGSTLTRGVSLPLIGIGVAAVRMAADFGQAMANVASISDESAESIAAMGDEILEMSKELPQSAEELAAGLYNIVSSGFDGAEAMTVLRESAEAASAGLASTDTAARAITAALNAYGLAASDAAAVSDIMFQGVKVGVMSFQELADTIGAYLGLANQLGVALEDVVAAQAAMTLSGFDAAEAAIRVNAVLKAMTKPSVALSDALEEIGYVSGTAAIEALGFEGTLKALIGTTDGSAEAMNDLFNESRAAQGAAALAADDFGNFEDALRATGDAAFSTGAALREQAAGPAFQMSVALNKISAAAITLGQTLLPVVVDTIIPALTDAAEWFGNLDDAMQENIVKWGGLVIALGPALIFLSALIRVGAGVAGLIGRLAGLGGMLLGLGGPLATAATGLFSMGAALTGVGAATPALLGILGSLGGALFIIASVAGLAYIAWAVFVRGLQFGSSVAATAVDVVKQGIEGLIAAGVRFEEGSPYLGNMDAPGAVEAKFSIDALIAAGTSWREGGPYAAGVYQTGAQESKTWVDNLISSGSSWREGGPYVANVTQTGAAAALDAISAASAAGQAWDGSIWTGTIVTKHVTVYGSAPAITGAEGGIVGIARGGVVPAQRGAMALVGEGTYHTFAGKGAEAILPLGQRGISILAEAVKRGAPEPTGPRQVVNLTVNGFTGDEDKLARLVSHRIGALQEAGWH